MLIGVKRDKGKQQTHHLWREQHESHSFWRISRDIARGGGAGRGTGFHPVTDIDPIRPVVSVRFQVFRSAVVQLIVREP
jgi:hypothetical protein